MKKYLLFALIVSVLFSGCTNFNGTRLEGLLGADENLVPYSYQIAQDLEETAVPALIPRSPDQPLLVTTFVDNNDLNQTSRFGRILQQNIASRFVQMGYTVREIKMRKNLLIRQRSGEIFLSRDIKEINPSVSAQAVLVGTYSITNRIMYISARLINPETSTIISSSDYHLVMDKNVLAMFGLEMAQDDSTTIEPPKESLINKIFY
jgi:TolB-like protein